MKVLNFIQSKFKFGLKNRIRKYPKILDTCLNDCLDHVFPGEGFVRFYMREIARDIQKTGIDNPNLLFSNHMDPRNLIFHVRDTMWLAEHLKHHAEKLIPDQQITLEDLESFVANSPVFERKRYGFEQHMVKCYIGECLNYQNDDIYSKSVEKILETSSKNYDKLFRERVVNAMSSLGVDVISIENGLEMNDDLWRKEVMGVTFANRYQHLGVTYSKGRTFQIPYEDMIQIKSAYHKYMQRRNLTAVHLLPPETLKHDVREVYEKWMALREYEYQRDHERTLRSLGKLPKNRLKPQDVCAITDFLSKVEEPISQEMNR